MTFQSSVIGKLKTLFAKEGGGQRYALFQKIPNYFKFYA